MAAMGAQMSQPARVKPVFINSPMPVGKLQPQLDAILEDSVYKHVANAVMNPGHGNNVQNALPYPDGYPGDVFIHKSTVRGEIRIPAESPSKTFQVALIPFAECPMAIKFDSDTAWQGVADTKYSTGTGSIIQCLTYPTTQGVYESRLIGKSVTIDNNTPQMFLAGNVTCCRMPANIDNNNPSITTGGTITASATNNRIIQNVPHTSGEMSLNLNSVNWNAKDGVYLVSKSDPNRWSTREHPWEKNASAYMGTAPNTNNTIDMLKITNMSGTLVNVVAGPSGYGTSSVFSPGMVSSFGFPTNGRDGSDIVTSLFEGLNTTGADNIFKFKMCIVREFRLKNTSVLLGSAVSRPPESKIFMEKLVNYSNALSGMYPADFNFWDKIWSGFKKVISKISDNLPGVSRLIEPFVPPQYQAAIEGINKVNDAGRNIYSLFDRPAGNYK